MEYNINTRRLKPLILREHRQNQATVEDIGARFFSGSTYLFYCSAIAN